MMMRSYLDLAVLLCGLLSTCLMSGQFAFYAKDIYSGKVIIDENGQLPLAAASVQKLFTAGLALDELGPEFKYETKVYSSGVVDDNGSLEGDIIIKGSGDPTLGSRYSDQSPDLILERIEIFIRNNGITCLRGRLIIDASILGDEAVPPTWAWYDLGNYYAAGIWGLNFQDNAHDVLFELSDDASNGPTLRSHNGGALLTFQNQLLSGPRGSGDQAYIYGGPMQFSRIIRGSLPEGDGEFKIRGSLPEPPRFFSEKLSKHLNAVGIQVEEVMVVYHDYEISGSMKLLGVLQSMKMSDIVAIMLEKSDNVYAEGLMRTVCPSPSFEVALKCYRSKVGYGKCEQSYFHDGSGLSQNNRIASRELVEYLIQSLGKRSGLREAISNVKKTSLSRYCGDDGARVKSGYTDGVRSYAGVLSNGVVFCTIYNGKDYKSEEIKKRIGRLLKKAMNY